MAKHNDLGKEGEILAAEYLQKKDFRILETNWRFEKKEIDIIAQKEDFIIIVEVKSRSTDFFGRPEEFVTEAQQRNLIEAADNYLQNLNYDAEVRFDIISIVMNKNKTIIKHIEDAFIPELE